MKIAMIGHKRIPSREGGVEIVVEELSKRLVRKGNKVEVYNRYKKKFPSVKTYEGVDIVTIPTINKKSLDALIYSLFATLKASIKRYDVIHYHAEGPCVMLWIPHVLGRKTVATIHGLDWKRAKWGKLSSWYLKLGERVAVKYADHIIVLSHNVQDYFKKVYHRETIYIKNGVTIPNRVRADQIVTRYGIGQGEYILFLARLVPEKGLHYLIEAFHHLETNKKLVIAGGASHSEEYVAKIKEMARKDNRIIMTGFVTGSLLEELYSNCCMYVLPSDVEGMPLSLLEAMSYGCQCVVSDIKENKEVVQEYGTCFKAGDVEDLKRKMKQVLCGKQKKREEIIEYIKEKFSWNEVVEKTLNCYCN